MTDANWAPWRCFLPPPSGALRSQSAHESTHGGKLYYLYTPNPEFYQWVLPKGAESPMGRKSPTDPAPVGFTIVKEAWSPLEVKLADVPRLKTDSPFDRTFPVEYLVAESKAYRIDKPQGIFVMLKKDPKTPGTDEGWIYGTVSADGKTVTSSGRVHSCMSCHVEASRDRLFGMHVERGSN